VNFSSLFGVKQIGVLGHTQAHLASKENESSKLEFIESQVRRHDLPLIAKIIIDSRNDRLDISRAKVNETRE